jgi:hypothetical protein
MEQEGYSDLHVLDSGRGRGAAHLIGTRADSGTGPCAPHPLNHRRGAPRVLSHAGLPPRLPKDTQVPLL